MSLPIKHRPFINKPVSKMSAAEREAFKDSVISLAQEMKGDRGITSDFRKALGHALLTLDGEDHPRRDSDLRDVFAGGEPDREDSDIWGTRGKAKTAFD